MGGSELVHLRSVEARFGSLEGLAFELMVNQPHLLEGGVDGVAVGLGLDRRVVSWLLLESREFQLLMDGFVAGGVWSAVERREAYGVLVERVRSGRERLADSVRAMEYLDGKVGLRRDAPPRPSVAIQIVQEGDGSWESDYEGLEFGGEGKRAKVGASEVVDVDFE